MNDQIKKRSKRPNIYITIIVGLIVFAIFCWLMISCTKIPFVLFGGNMNQDFNGEFVKFSASIIAGGFLFFGLLLNARRTKAVEKQNKLTRKGQVDERFKNAIEHLGNDKDAIVLGGIYALHRIAEEDKSYRKTVFDILCSYIRDKTSTLKDWSEYSVDERTAIKPTIVIQTIIDLLFKCDDIQEYIYAGLQANLNGIRCIRANFFRARLKEANLSAAHLEDAYLFEAHLEDAVLSKCHLVETNLCKAHLENAIISSCHLEGAVLIESHLQKARILKSHLEGAILWDAHLEEANLYGAHMAGADLSKANMGGANLVNTHFEGAKLRKTRLEGTNLYFSNLEGADLFEAHLEGANINSAFLEGAFLIESNWEGVSSSEIRPQNEKFMNHSLTDSISTEFSLLDFTSIIQNRIEEKSEFNNNHIGKLDENKAKDIIEKISPTIKNELSLLAFQDRIKEAVNRDTNIEEDSITGILTKEKADEIIERYNKAMANVPKH